MLGRITNSRVDGYVFKFFEGEILLGQSSSPAGVLDPACLKAKMEELDVDRIASLKKGIFDMNQYDQSVQRARTDCTREINPWPVSSYRRELVEEVKEAENKLVVVHYKSYAMQFFVNSPNLFDSYSYVNSNYELPTLDMDISGQMMFYNLINYSKGFYEGRIVKASWEGLVRHGHEVIVQVGQGGRQFIIMAVSDRKLYNFILMCMATGKILRIYYYQLYTPLAAISNAIYGLDTNLRIYRVEVTEEDGDSQGDHDQE